MTGFRTFQLSPVLVALFLPITLLAVMLHHPFEKLTIAANYVGVDDFWFFIGAVVVVMLIPFFLNVIFNLDLIFIAIWDKLTS